MMSVRRPKLQFLSGLMAVAALMTATGCGGSGDRPNLGLVSGVVTLDGKPLSGASVSFNQAGFRPSIGMTDNEGRYELVYLRDIKGATLGKHVVKIKLVSLSGEPIKQLPKKYNSDSQLNYEVKAGENEFNFELKSAS